MHYRVHYMLDFDLKICSGQVCPTVVPAKAKADINPSCSQQTMTAQYIVYPYPGDKANPFLAPHTDG